MEGFLFSYGKSQIRSQVWDEVQGNGRSHGRWKGSNSEAFDHKKAIVSVSICSVQVARGQIK